MKRWYASYVVRGLQIKTKVRYYYASIRMAEAKNTDNTECW